MIRWHRSLLIGVAVVGCATGSTTTTSSSAATATATAPAKPAAQRVTYKPDVVFSSFGEVDFDHDAQVMQRYLEALRSVAHACVPGERTAREKLDGAPARHECPPADPLAADTTPVKVLVDSIPEGIDIANGKIQVAAGRGITLVGRMSWEVPKDYSLLNVNDALTANNLYVFRRRKAEIVDELKHLARAASANLVLISFMDEKTDQAHGAAGLLFRVDLSTLDTSKNRMGKVPTEI